LEEATNSAGKVPAPDSDPFSDTEFAQNLACLSRQMGASRIASAPALYYFYDGGKTRETNWICE